MTKREENLMIVGPGDAESIDCLLLWLEVDLRQEARFMAAHLGMSPQCAYEELRQEFVVLAAEGRIERDA